MTGLIISAALLCAVFGFALIQREIYRRYWAKNLIFSLRSSKSAVFEGETAVLRDSLTNGKRLPLPWVHIGYKLSSALIYTDKGKTVRDERRAILFTVGMFKTFTRKSNVLCAKRGFYTVTDCTVSSNNILMTNFVYEHRKLNFGLLVYPKIVDYHESVIPLKRMLGEVPVKRFTDPNPFTFKGIREYQSYDSFRQINWNATAKTGELMSNIYDFTDSRDFTVLLNLQNYSRYNREFVYEEAIRLAAFILRRCVEAGVPAGLVCPAWDGKPAKIGGGMTKAHLETVYAALAYINIYIANYSVADYLPVEKDKSFILISPFRSDDLIGKFRAIREVNAGAYWIVPYCNRDTAAVPAADGIIGWEVLEDAEN
jgi:hypothetical protein